MSTLHEINSPPHSVSAANNACPSPTKRAKVTVDKGKGLVSGKPAVKGSKTAVASSSTSTEETPAGTSSPSTSENDRHSSKELCTVTRTTFPGSDYARKLTLSEASHQAEVDTLSTKHLVKMIFNMQCKSMLSYKKAIFKCLA
jgi:hypothetical protein